MALDKQMDLSQPLEQLARLPRGLRILVLLGVAAAVISLYGFTLYRGMNRQLTGLQGRLTQVQSKIAESRAVASNLKSFEAKQVELKDELELALRRLPNEKELPVLLTDMSSLGKKSGLEIRYFRPSGEINHGFYAEVPINIEFLGRYHEVGVFFDRLSRLPRIVNITELSMGLAKTKSSVPMLSVKGIATTFRFVEAPPTPEGGA
jgi:type IV pilus assembly protein PilO